MYNIDNERFGQFLSRLRKNKGLTQRELAEKLFLSDKAVSKWETGKSLPDIAVLTPLADILDVTVTELLNCGNIESDSISISEVEDIVCRAVELSSEKSNKIKAQERKNSRKLYFICVFISVLEFILLIALRLWPSEVDFTLITAEILMLIFGTYFSLFVKDELPYFYDKEKINFISDGMFRMNVPGIRFNNSNWPHIVSYTRKWILTIMLLLPVIYLVSVSISPPFWGKIQTPLMLVSALSLFLPVYIAGKKYE